MRANKLFYLSVIFIIIILSFNNCFGYKGINTHKVHCDYDEYSANEIYQLVKLLY